jgi:tartrate-resistant acid phosphatase type 5
MNVPFSPSISVSRRRFLRQSFAFSALASLSSAPGWAGSLAPASAGAAELLMVGDWGYDNDHTAQSQVALGMRRYAKERDVDPQALFMLGDNWYGELAGGAQSLHWQTQFETMYPADAFPGPAYAILGNHDYQKWPDSKVESELEYARLGHSR